MSVQYVSDFSFTSLTLRLSSSPAIPTYVWKMISTKNICISFSQSGSTRDIQYWMEEQISQKIKCSLPGFRSQCNQTVGEDSRLIWKPGFHQKHSFQRAEWYVQIQQGVVKFVQDNYKILSLSLWSLVCSFKYGIPYHLTLFSFILTNNGKNCMKFVSQKWWLILYISPVPRQPNSKCVYNQLAR